MLIHQVSSLRQCHRGGRVLRVVLTALCAGAIFGMAGCQQKPVAPPKAAVKNPPLPADSTLPEFLKGTIKDYTVLNNTGPFVVSSYGLVVNLRNTGNSDCPTPVRDWMIKEMYRHGLGSQRLPGYENLTPEGVLQDPRVSVVEVAGFIPPGARAGQKFDIVVQAIAGNRTTSLARGFLYRTDLRVDGANAGDPGGSVNDYAKAQGYLFVNPAYAINSNPTQPGSAASLRSATIPGGGYVTHDRELRLRLREPSWSMARTIERRIAQQFQDNTIAAAQDEAFVFLYTPVKYRGDWRHFEGVVRHLYVNGSPDFLNAKAKQLAVEATKPNAPLLDISYCWEAMGPMALQYVSPLLASKQPDIEYAAARAAAFLHDRFGEERLLQIARSREHPFRLAAIQDFGDMPGSPYINAGLADLLGDSEPLVRIAAYTVLVKNNDPHIFSKLISSEHDPENQFLLDIVDAGGPPLIYATRVGEPRVVIFGRKVAMNTPVTFAAFDTRLTISTAADRPRWLTIYYRADDRPKAIQVISGPDLPELIARLGGINDDGLHFTYGEVVAMLQSMVDSHKVGDAARANALFVLQDLPGVERRINSAAAIPDSTRPQTDDNQGTAPDSLPVLPKYVPPAK